MVIIYFLLLGIFVDLSDEVKNKIRHFPPQFLFGASSSAYQVEGAWEEDGKSLSIWDVAVHANPDMVQDGTTGDVSTDSYHLYQKDVQLAKELGLDFYKFSISWTRILPNGFADKVNPLGIKYYKLLIEELLVNKIRPMVTMYHWDLPQNLQKFGGWSNPLIVGWFVDYAKVLFTSFGEKVKYWITINDPKAICVGGYGSTSQAPMMNVSGIAEYICVKNVLLAHAKVYELYNKQFRKTCKGSIGISISFVWYEPASGSYDDHQAAEDARKFDWEYFAHPIFSSAGDYPEEVKNNVAVKSAEQGFPKSRLPELSAAEVSLIKGSADFLGVNSYTTRLTYRDASLDGMYPVPSFMDDQGAVLIKDPSWTQAASTWLQEVPWGFLKVLMAIKSLYDNPPVYITENGWSTSGNLLDEDRIHYLRAYLNVLLDAVFEGADIRGYSVRSLTDSFEWFQGYTEKFGLYEVDFSSSDKARTPRKSAFVYKEICRSKTLDPDFEPEKFLVDGPEKNPKFDQNHVLTMLR
ncbi:unnamed protein product [Arctia plantaginis]|uniref:Myrosinase 1-like n=1 Tax=Arctia plantaginis TaxID=874455 RepID=A0A8S0YY45_ARCPL|nr:unnamed protein product [Arctia plantaginis]